MKKTLKKAVIITDSGFEDMEVVYPYYRLLERGLKVEIATKDGEEVQGKHGLWLKKKYFRLVNSQKLKEKDYLLVVVPGGYEAPDRVRQIKEVLNFLKAMDKKEKIIAAVCHGSWVLISAGLVKGRKMTCYWGCKDDLVNAGAKYLDKPVVVDKNIITSPHFRDMHLWMKEIIKRTVDD